MKVFSGGTYIHNTTSNDSTLLASSVLDTNSTFIYRGSSSLTPAVQINGNTYGHLLFDVSSGSWSSTLTGSAITHCSDFTVGTGVSLTNNYTGSLTVDGDFILNGTFSNGTGTQAFLMTGSNNSMNGTLAAFYDSFTIDTLATYLILNNVTVSPSSTFTVKGTLDCGTRQVNGSGLGNTFNLNAGALLRMASASGLQVSVGGFQIKNFNSGANYEFYGSVTQTANFTGYNTTINNLTINTSAGAQVDLTSTTLTMNGTLFLTSGNFTIGTNTIILNGPAIAGTSTNLITASTSSLRFGGTAAGVFIPSTVSALTNLVINKSANHVDFNNNLTVSGNLTLTNGKFITGIYSLTFTGTSLTGGITGTSYVNGTMIRRISAGNSASIYFPVGVNSFDPVTISNINNSAPTDLQIIPPDIGADEYQGPICSKILNLKVFFEGFYLAGDSMIAIIDPVNSPTLFDSLTVQLVDSLDLNTVAASDTSIISIHGYGTFSFNPSLLIPLHKYYIVTRHRSALETWSKFPVLFDNPVVAFDFTSP